MSGLLSTRRPYIEGSPGGLHGAYVVRDTPAGEAIGSVAHAGWRSWVAWCADGCAGIVERGSTRIAAARALYRHQKAAHR